MPIIRFNTVRKMAPDEFATHMENITKFAHDPEKHHSLMDGLMVKALESCGYDLSIFKEAETWCA